MLKKIGKRVFIIICIIIVIEKNIVRPIQSPVFTYDQIDILAVGNSNLYSSLSPKLYYELYDKKVYMLSSAYQGVDQTYANLKKALNEVKPQMIIYEVDNLYTYLPDCFLPDTAKTSVEIGQKRPQYLNQYGFYDSQRCVPSLTMMETKDSHQKQSITNISLLYFHHIVELSRKNNVPLVLISAPCLTTWSIEKHNYISELAMKNNLDYIDFNVLEDMKVNWLLDTRDGGTHLNNNGAIKVTTQLGKMLEKKNYVVE